jgi:large subunit ribosomal protein L35
MPSRRTNTSDTREDKMPKMKTKSSAKKRFRFTASGKIRMKPSGMRHGMSKRSQSMKRKARKTGIMAAADAKIVRPTMPYSKRG